jgi:hypothetical protein
MLRNLTWQATDTLTRAQLAMFHALGNQIGLSEDDRWQALDLDARTWAMWTAFLSDGPLPGEPPLPEMLRRLGETVFNLSAVAERCNGEGHAERRHQPASAVPSCSLRSLPAPR